MKNEQDPVPYRVVRPDGAAIRKAREAKGWQQKNLAKAAGVAKRTVEKAESEAGKPSVRLRYDVLECIAEALGKSAEELTKEPEEDVTRRPDYGLNGSGITHAYPKFPLSEFEKALQESSGMVVILNTWIENLQELTDPLIAAIKRDKSLIVELIQLDPTSLPAKERAKELPKRDVESAIRSEFGRIQTATNRLSAQEQKRLRLFTIDFIPKFALYAVGECCFVGFFWPSDPAVTKPQLLVRGKTGYFATEIWAYLEMVQKRAKPTRR